MSRDMTKDIFAEQQYGQLALKKLAPVSENFRCVLEVTGAEFRVAKTGPNHGKLSIMVHSTQRSTHVTRKEIVAATTRAEQAIQGA